MQFATTTNFVFFFSLFCKFVALCKSDCSTTTMRPLGEQSAHALEIGSKRSCLLCEWTKYKTNALKVQRNQMDVDGNVWVSQRLQIEIDCSSSSMVEVTVAVVHCFRGFYPTMKHIKERVAQLQCAFDKSKRTSALHKSTIRPNRIFYSTEFWFLRLLFLLLFIVVEFTCWNLLVVVVFCAHIFFISCWMWEHCVTHYHQE